MSGADHGSRSESIGRPEEVRLGAVQVLLCFRPAIPEPVPCSKPRAQCESFSPITPPMIIIRKTTFNPERGSSPVTIA